MEVPAHCWRHPSTAPLCLLSEDVLCSVIVDTLGTVACWQTGKHYPGWFIAVCFRPEGTKACPAPKHCRIKTKRVSCIPEDWYIFYSDHNRSCLGEQELHTSLLAERRQSGVERVRMDLTKHFPLEDIHSLLVFCTRARPVTTELKINY